MSGSVTEPLSLSFCATSLRLGPAGLQRGFEPSPTSAYLPSNRETEIIPSDPSSTLPIASTSKSRLADIDHIKVYYPRAMLARRALGEWVYKEDRDAGDLRNPVEAIWILDFTKLVLVDKRREGVLIS